MVCSPGDHQVRIPRVQTCENQVYVVIYAYSCIHICNIYIYNIRIIHTATHLHPFSTCNVTMSHTQKVQTAPPNSHLKSWTQRRECAAHSCARQSVSQESTNGVQLDVYICILYFQCITLTRWFLSLAPHVYSRAMHHPPTSLSKMMIDMDEEETGSPAVSLAG